MCVAIILIVLTVSYILKDLKDSDKPRERLIKLGPEALSSSELLAVLLRTGGKGESSLILAGKLLSKFEGLEGLVNASLEQLEGVKNIGRAKAVEIKAVFEIALRIALKGEAKRKIIENPKDAFNLVRKDFYSKKREELHLLSLDSRQKVIAKDIVSMGTVNETVVHPREIYRQALLRNAVSIILVPNHPSQDTTPSSEDILLTEKVSKAGVILGISLIDHLVVSNKEYTSLKALGVFKVRKFDQKGGE